MRIAVASKDGRLIDQHFGHAERFLIYEVIEPLIHPHPNPLPKGEGGFEIRLLEERTVEKYCSGDIEHLYDTDRLEKFYAVIKDCRFLLVSRIGTIPEKELLKKGIKTLIVYDWIEEGIKNAISKFQITNPK